MTPEEEIRELELDLERLKKEKATLEKIKEAKIKRLKLKFGSIPARFAAKHPYLSEAGKGTFNFFKYVGKNVVANQERADEERKKRMEKYKKKAHA